MSSHHCKMRTECVFLTVVVSTIDRKRNEYTSEP